LDNHPLPPLLKEGKRNPWNLNPGLAVLLAMLFFAIASVVWALRVPVVNGKPVSLNPDEPSHFAVAKYIADNGSLPPYTYEYYESAHPPLYHAIAAGFLKLWPVGTQVYALRLLSTLFGLCTILLIFRMGLLFLRPWSAAVGACLVATLPMFVMVSGSITNDSFAALVSTATLYVLVKILVAGLTKRRGILGGALLACAGLTKYTCFGLLPVSVWAVLYDRKRAGRSWLTPTLGLVAAFLLAAGPWLWRNQVLYGDPLRAGAEQAMGHFGPGAEGGGLRYWIEVGWTVLMSFLGPEQNFPAWGSGVLNTLAAVFGVAVIAALVGVARMPRSPIRVVFGWFAVLVVVAVLVYQIKHFQPHGRLLAPAVAVFGLGMAAGLRRVVPAESRMLIAVVGILGFAAVTVGLVTTAL
jgi:4-amino-4-deoxy-L-arabinose transferase-like glycosyltransferase